MDNDNFFELTRRVDSVAAEMRVKDAKNEALRADVAAGQARVDASLAENGRIIAEQGTEHAKAIAEFRAEHAKAIAENGRMIAEQGAKHTRAIAEQGKALAESRAEHAKAMAALSRHITVTVLASVGAAATGLGVLISVLLSGIGDSPSLPLSSSPSVVIYTNTPPMAQAPGEPVTQAGAGIHQQQTHNRRIEP